MENLDLTYKLIALKIKRKTLDQIYFMSQVFQEHSHCYDNRNKKEKWKLQKIIYFCCHPFPLSIGGGGGGGGRLLQPPPTTFFVAKILEIFFFIDKWVSGKRVGRWTVWQKLAKTQKRHKGKSEKGGGGGGLQPLLRKRFNIYIFACLFPISAVSLLSVV